MTGNIDDFLGGAKSCLPTDVIAHRRKESGRTGPAVAAITRFGKPHLIVAVPQEVIVWLTRAVEPSADSLRVYLRVYYGAAPRYDAETAATGPIHPGYGKPPGTAA